MLWLLYFYTIVDNIHQLLVGSTFLLFALLFINLMYLGETNEGSEERTYGSKIFVRLLITLVVVCFLKVALPDSKGIVLLAGGAFTQSVVQTQEAKDVGNKVLTLLNQQLDAHIEKPVKEK